MHLETWPQCSCWHMLVAAAARLVMAPETLSPWPCRRGCLELQQTSTRRHHAVEEARRSLQQTFIVHQECCRWAGSLPECWLLPRGLQSQVVLRSVVPANSSLCGQIRFWHAEAFISSQQYAYKPCAGLWTAAEPLLAPLPCCWKLVMLYASGSHLCTARSLSLLAACAVIMICPGLQNF